MDFYEKYTDYSDVQIIEILKNHKDYQESAVDAAVKIAIERELIHSEQDLLTPEFQNVNSNRKSLFPNITNDFQRQKLQGSIFRFLYIISFVPLIYGFLKYAEGQYTLTTIGVGSGVLWFILSFLFAKTKKTIVFISLFFLLVSISIYCYILIFSKTSIQIMDLVILTVGLLLPTYLLILLWKLIQNKP